ncbi:MAG TPA: TIR domain-containing protein [Rhizomicrobium sp.]
MAGDAQDQEDKYWAFISYSHRDAAFGRRLHRRLESYALPARLVGKETKQGPVPRRLAPIFRDRDEFPAAHNLSTEVRGALKASRSLVVVCSPTAAQSTWVAREIELFRELHPDRPILTALAKGEPEESFPDALRFSGPDGAAIEPLAADFRREGDGTRSAVLKLVAGIIGIGLDELVQRDAQRNFRRVMAVTVVAGITVLIMAALTAFALIARSEAERQRAKAEGLVEFMITDLHDKLKGVGRLDVTAAVNDKALQYYADQDLSKLPVASLERRARVLHAMAEDDGGRGDYDAELRTAQEAGRTTEALLAAAPNDPVRIYNHAQTEFWIGNVAFYQKRYDAAAQAFQSYKTLAEHLIGIAPRNPTWQMEAGYAEESLCSVAVKKRLKNPETLRACKSALDHMERAAKLHSSKNIAVNIANQHEWIADAYRLKGDMAHAKQERIVAEAILNEQMAADPKNMDLKVTWVADQVALASFDRISNPNAARARLLRAKDVIEAMTNFDPKNKAWSRERDIVEHALDEVSTKPISSKQN